MEDETYYQIAAATGFVDFVAFIGLVYVSVILFRASKKENLKHLKYFGYGTAATALQYVSSVSVSLVSPFIEEGFIGDVVWLASTALFSSLTVALVVTFWVAVKKVKC